MDDKLPPVDQDAKTDESSSELSAADTSISPSTADSSSNAPPTAPSMVPVTMRTGGSSSRGQAEYMAIKVKSVLRQGEKCKEAMVELVGGIAMRLAEDRSRLGDHTLAVEIEQFLVISAIQLYLGGDMVESLEYWASCDWQEDNFWILKEELEVRLTVERRLRELYEGALDSNPPWNARLRQLMVNDIRMCTGFDNYDPDSVVKFWHVMTSRE